MENQQHFASSDENQWVCAELKSWQSFLPKNAILMGRKNPLPSSNPSTQKSLNAPVLEKALEQKQENRQQSIHNIAMEWNGCQRCKLCEKRTNIVMGEGNLYSPLVFIGEGPGEQEDFQGRPFVGKAGQLLDRMIEAIGLKRNEVYIANIVKCRPPNNRAPEPDEIQSCYPILRRQLQVIQPKIIVALGKTAAQTLLMTDQRISEVRGQFFPWQGIKLMPTFHPAYLLRNPSSKREAWIDLQKVAKELGIEIPKRVSSHSMNS